MRQMLIPLILFCYSSATSTVNAQVRLPPVELLPEEAIAESDPEVDPETSIYWYEPTYWFRPGWDGDVELGINGSEGSAQSFSLRLGVNLKRETETNVITAEAVHARTTADTTETQNNALGRTRYEHLLGNSCWTWFTDGSLEYDEFKAFDLRLAGNGGLGYRFIDHECTSLQGRFGSGVSHELGGPDDSYVPEAVFGADFEHQWTDRQKITLKADYFPEWGDFANYRLLIDAGWEILLDEDANLSLKVGVIDRYDSTPNGRKPNDVDYSLLLIWKL